MPTTFAALLAEQTRPAADPGRPLVTWYGAEPGERVELSVTSFANWVAKTASLLQDELDLERGDRVLVDLPSHWLGPVWLGACWALGTTVLAPGTPEADDALVVCGPGTLEQHVEAGSRVVATSLAALGTRFTQPLPAGVVDFGEVVWGQPDAFTVWDPPQGDDPAWTDADGTLSQAEVLALRLDDGTGPRRVATVELPVSRAGLARLLHPLASGGGSVWVSDPAALERVAATERAQPA